VAIIGRENLKDKGVTVSLSLSMAAAGGVVKESLSHQTRCEPKQSDSAQQTTKRSKEEMRTSKGT
jgi:hypothetical protein